MPELTLEASHSYWKQYPDPMIYRVVTFMENVEQWVKDDLQELNKAVEALGHELEDVAKINFDELGQQELFIHLINNMKMPQALRLMQALDTANPGSASKLLMHAERISGNAYDEAGIFLRRNAVFERFRLLGRIFSSSRLNLILKAIEDE